MTQSDYAKRRGVSKPTIRRAIDSGRLVQSVARDSDGKILGISDPELADREWAANTDYTDAPQRAASAQAPTWDNAPSAHAEMSINDAAATEKIWKAKSAELKYRQEAAELVPARDVANKVIALFTNCKTKLLGVPSRARQALPHLSASDSVVLEGLVREALEDLANGVT